MTTVYDDGIVTLLHGDAIEVLRDMAECSVDAIVTDPPYGLEFMGKTWDRFDGTIPGRGARIQEERAEEMTPTGKGHTGSKGPYLAARVDQFIAGTPYQAWCQAWAEECLRVLKPGGHLLAFGGTRTYHRLATAIEDAGFDIRDCLVWGYMSGFPKSLNVSKQDGVCHCGAVSTSEQDVRDLRDADVSTSESTGEVLLPSVSERSPRLWGTDGPEADEAQGNAGRLESSVEGRSDVLQETRQLHRSPLRPSAGVGAPDGPEGRVHHGASAGSGSMGGALADQNGGSESPRPQAVEQQSDEPRAVADECGSQAGRVWPLCDRCGEPMVGGRGTALKPAWEPIVMARKPLVGTVVSNVLRYGTGSLNIDATRIPLQGDESYDINTFDNGAKRAGVVGTDLGISNADVEKFQQAQRESTERLETLGRWPANVMLTDPIFDGDYPDEVTGGGSSSSGFMAAGTTRTSQSVDYGVMPDTANLTDTYADSGGKSRFFLVPKADRSERERGLAGAPQDAGMHNGKRRLPDTRERSPHALPQRINTHPTVKPLDLMRHLVRLVTPPGGIVLDPFVGSGTTMLAASEEGFRGIGIDQSSDYLTIAEGRLTATPIGMGL